MNLTVLTRAEADRFWKKVRKAGDDECWEWTACRTGAKMLGWYGRFALRKKRYYAHRVAWCLSRNWPMEYLTDRLAILHTCDNPICCNPAHLLLGTQLLNVQDMIRKARHRNGYTSQRSKNPVTPIEPSIPDTTPVATQATADADKAFQGRIIINHPSGRTAWLNNVIDKANLGNDYNMIRALRLSVTPPALTHLPDHMARGQKSLGRIQQLLNRRRFKVRPRVSN